MATIVNDRDVLLQEAEVRFIPPPLPQEIQDAVDAVKGLSIISTGTQFVQPAEGDVTPESISFSVEFRLIEGTVTWSVVQGEATLTPTGNLCVLTAENLESDRIRVRAELTLEEQDENGDPIEVTYFDELDVTRVKDGMTGMPGDAVEFIFRRNPTKPATPSPSASIPSGWYNDVDMVPPINAPLWQCLGQMEGGADKYTWQEPVKIEGADGLSVVELTIYRRATSTPPTPSGGTFNFATQTLTPPSGWSWSIPAGTDPIYISKAVVSTQGTTGSVPVTGWTAPILSIRNGEDGAPGDPGADGDSIDVIFRRSATQPATPGASSGTPSGWYSNVNQVPVSNAPMWSCVGRKSGAGATYTWQTPVKLDGTAITELTIYRRSASTPPTPSGGTFNFATQTLTPPTNWSWAIPSGTDPVWMAKAVVTAYGDTTSVTVGTWTTPVISFRDGEDGSDGAPGTRGTVQVSVSRPVASWLDSAADSAITSYTGSSVRIPGDQVTQYNTPGGWAQTRYWTGSAWQLLEQVLDGNLMVTGSLVADKITSGTFTGLKFRTAASGDRVEIDNNRITFFHFNGTTEVAPFGSGWTGLQLETTGSSQGVRILHDITKGPALTLQPSSASQYDGGPMLQLAPAEGTVPLALGNTGSVPSTTPTGGLAAVALGGGRLFDLIFSDGLNWYKVLSEKIT